MLMRGRPRAVVSDNSPEFVSQAPDLWGSTRGVRLDFIHPGRPWRTVSLRASMASCGTNA